MCLLLQDKDMEDNSSNSRIINKKMSLTKKGYFKVVGENKLESLECFKMKMKAWISVNLVMVEELYLLIQKSLSNKKF